MKCSLIVRTGLFGLSLAAILACDGGGSGGGSYAYPGYPPSIYITSNDTGDRDIYVWSASNGTVKNLTKTAGDDYNPATGSSYIFFASTRGGGSAHIWRMDTNGSNPKQLTFGPDIDELPASTNGKVAFARTHNGVQTIWTMDINGNNLTQLSTEEGYDPAWNEGGTKIAFASARASLASEIWVMNADGTNPVQITTTAPGDTAKKYVPAWISNIIVYGVEDDHGHQSLWTMKPDGTNQTLFRDSGGKFLDWPRFGDGDDLVFTEETSEGSGDAIIHTVNFFGGTPAAQGHILPSTGLTNQGDASS